MIGLNVKSTFSLSKHHCSLWFRLSRFRCCFSRENVAFAKQKVALDTDVAIKPLEAVRFAAENNRMRELQFVWIKVVGHTEKLQLTTFCGNWENVELRARRAFCCEI